MVFRNADRATDQQCPQQRQQDDIARAGFDIVAADQLGCDNDQQRQPKYPRADADIQR